MTAQERAKQHLASQGRTYGKSGTAQKLAQNFLAQEEERKRKELEAYRDKVIENRQSHHFDIIQNAYGQSRYGRVGNITADDYSIMDSGSYDPRRQFAGRGGADAPSASMTQLGAVAPQKMKADLAWRQYNRYKDMERYGLVSGSEPTETPTATRGNGPRVRGGGAMAEERQRYEVPLTDTPSWMEEKAAPYMRAPSPEAAEHLNDPAERYMRGIDDHDLTAWYLRHADEQTKQDLRTVISQSTEPYQVAIYIQNNIKPKADKYYADEYQRMLDEAYETAKSIEQDGDFMQGIREYWNAFWGGLSTSFGDTTVSGLVNQANMNRRSAEGKSNTGLEIATGIGGMTPSLLLSPLGPATAAVVLGAQSMIRASREAIADGADNVEAGLYGALVGTTEALLSRFLGGISAFAGKTSLGSSIGNVITKAFSKVPRNVITKPLISLAVKTGKAIPEFIEEGLQSVISPALANITYGKEVDWENIPENMLHDGLIGAATAAVLNIAFSPVTRATRTASLTRADVENALPKPLAQAISQYEQSGSISDKAARRIEADLASQTALMALEPMDPVGITQGALDVIRAEVAKIPKAKVVGSSPTASVSSIEANLENEHPNYDPDIDNIEDLSGVSKRARNAVRTVLNGKNIDGIQANQILSDPVAIKKIEYILGISLDSQKNKSVRRNQLMEAVKNYASYNARKPTDTTGITPEAEQALMILQKNQRISHTNALKIANDPVASRVFNVLYGNELGKTDNADTKAAKIVSVSKKLFYQDNAERMSAISEEVRPIVEAFINGEQISGKQADKIFADPVAVGVVEAYLGEPVSNQQPMSLKQKTLTQMSQSQENVSESPVVEKAVSSPVENWSTKRDNTNNQKKVYSLSEIVKAASKIFGVSPRVGALKDSTAPGEFNRQTGSIRLADDNDIPVLMHEFGHMMDKRLQIRENAPESVKSELVANFGRKDVYPQEKWLSEGIAEFARELITNPESAQKKYPQSYRYLMSKLSPSMQKAIFETLAPAVNTYLSADLDSRALAATKADKDRIGVPWIVQHSETARKIYDWFNDNSFKEWWITHITDDLYGIDAASRKLGVDLTANYQLALNSRTSIRGRTMAAITKGLTDIDGNIIGRSFQSCFEPILEAVDGRHGGKRKLGEWTNDYNQTMNDFGLYLICRRGVDIRKSEDPNRSIFADPNLDSLEYMQSVVDKAPVEFQEAAKRIYEFFDKQIDMRVAAGTISEEEATAWRKAHPHWVPFERDVPGGKIDPTKPMTGSTKDFKGVFQAMAKITAQTITSTTQNTIRRDILQTITSLPDSAWFATRNPDADFTEVSPSNNSDNRPWEAYEHGKKEKTWDVGVYENGQRISYTINDKAFFTALSSLTPPTTRGVLRIFKSLNALFTSTVTGKNLPWNITSNAPRDFQTMGLSFEVSDLVEGLKNYVKSFATFDTENQSEDMRKFFILTSGGSELSSTLFRDEREINIRKKLMTGDLHGVDKAKARFLLGDIHPFGFISTVADYVETRSRIAAYLTARSNGKSHQEAIFESQDITTNFNRRGKWSKNINQFIPFFNAGVQGLSKSFRNYTGYKNAYESGSDRAKRAGAYVLKSTLFAVVASTLEAVAAMGLWNGDEEERKKAQNSWNRLSTYQKNNSWNIYIGDDTYISLKKPRELGILPSVVGRFAEAIVTENANTWYDFGSYAFENLLPPLLDVLPVMAEGVIAGEGWTNEFIGGAVSSLGFAGNVALALAGVDYRGNEIVPSSVSDRLPKEQYTEQTTTIAKALGAFLNMSPMQVDYALQNFGVLQNINEAFFTDENKSFMERLGGFLGGNSLIKKSTYSTDITSIFYDNRTYATQYANSYPDDIGAKVEAKEYNSMASFYSAFNNLQKNELESEEKQTARRTVLDMLDQFNYEMENGYDKQVIDLMHNFSEDVVDWNKNARGENDTELSPTEFYPATMATVLGETKLNSEQYYVYQTTYLDAYYTLVAEAFASDTVSVPTMYKRIRKAKEKAKKQADNYMAEYLNLTGGK